MVEHAYLAVDHELALPYLQCGLADPWKTPSPIQSASRRQANVLAIADDAAAVAIVLDFVDPVGTGGNCLGVDRLAILKF